MADTRYILKVEPKKFAAGLDVGCERKKSRMTPRF